MNNYLMIGNINVGQKSKNIRKLKWQKRYHGIVFSEKSELYGLRVRPRAILTHQNSLF